MNLSELVCGCPFFVDSNDFDALLFEKKNEQVAGNLLDDFEAAISTLAHVADNLKMCENPYLKDIGYRRINFMSHRYFMLYRVEGNMVFVDNIFHELQDYENKMI